MNILLVNLTKLVDDSGGMAKVNCALANALYEKGHNVSIMYSDVKTGSFFYYINPSIYTVDLRHYKNQVIRFPIWFKIKREFYRLFNKRKSRSMGIHFSQKYLSKNCQEVLQNIQPDIILSFNPGSSALLLTTLKTKIPVVTMSHGDPSDYMKFYPWDSIEAVRLSRVNQVLLPSFKEKFLHDFPGCKVEVIGNAIPQYKVAADLSIQKEMYKIIFVGRLNENHKRPHLALEAFAKIAHKYPNWSIEFWGDIDSKVYFKMLQAKVKQHGLEKQCFFKGVTNDVESVLQEGDIFVVTSAYEGFGMSLAEAMAKGLPAVGYANTSGINELIQDSVTGFLCDDGIDNLANRLEYLIQNQHIRVKMGLAGREAVKIYSSSVIWSQWESLLLKTIQECK